MSIVLGPRSLSRLQDVHPDLVRVVKRALELTAVDFMVIEGVRSVERQAHLKAIGASHTMRSRHLTGHAVDIAPYIAGEIRWDWPLYDNLSKTIKQAAKDCGIPLEWGGDWKTFRDGPHWQLPWKSYK